VTNTILQPGEIEVPKPGIPFLRLPERRHVFARRADRLDASGRGHTMADYLRFAADLARAQQAVLDTFPEVPLPGPEQRELCRRHGLPVLGARGWQRDPAWRVGLRAILERMSGTGLPALAQAAIARLEGTADAELEGMAASLLCGQFAAVAPQATPFIAAALQIYWVHMAAALGEGAFGRLEQPALCPVCGSPPVASIVRIGGAEQGLRYLSCSLCAAEWHMVRITCTSCQSTKGIAYYGLEGASAALRAEACEECRTYLKILYMEKDSSVEPAADDLASLALDVLMNQAGWERVGPNPLFHPGV
jgi:FdhE protein